MTPNSIGYPGRVQSISLKSRDQDGNNYGHRYPEQVKDTEKGGVFILGVGGRGYGLSHNYTPCCVTALEGRYIQRVQEVTFTYGCGVFLRGRSLKNR